MACMAKNNYDVEKWQQTYTFDSPSRGCFSPYQPRHGEDESGPN